MLRTDREGRVRGVQGSPDSSSLVSSSENLELPHSCGQFTAFESSYI